MSTETVTPEAEVTEPETKVIPSLDDLGGDVSLAGLIVNKAKGVKAALDKVASQLKSAGNVGDLLSEALKSSDNETVIDRLKKIELANQKILEWTKEAEDIVKPTLNVPTEDELKALEESYKGFASQIKTFDTVFVNEVKATYPDLTIYDYVGDLPKGRRGSTGAKTGQGEGSSRPRVNEVAVSTDNGETYNKVTNEKGSSTFSALVAWVKKETGVMVSASDFHEAWYDAYQITEWSAAPEQSSFGYSVTSEDQKTHQFMVRVTK
jgi:hypothetical protein